MKSASQHFWLLDHCYEKDCGCDEYKLIGAFATQAAAVAVKKKLVKKAGFRRYPRSFIISKCTIGRVGWETGFVSMLPPKRRR